MRRGGSSSRMAGGMVLPQLHPWRMELITCQGFTNNYWSRRQPWSVHFPISRIDTSPSRPPIAAWTSTA